MQNESNYQIAMIGPAVKGYSIRLRDLLDRRFKALSRKLPQYVEVLTAAQHNRLSNKSPVIGLYFGPGNPSVNDLAALSALERVADVVIPVVDNTKDYTTKVPAPLHPINAFAAESDPTLDQLANLVLENLGLLRRGRRLFISYRRTESAAVAEQLRDVLDRSGFDVFLDTHSVPKGDRFQEVLWHRLADSEIMLILDTKGFLGSRWTSAELAEAHAMSVAMIQIIWPDATPEPYSELCHRFSLGPRQLVGGLLTTSTMSRLSRTIERHRARAMASRHDNLTGEFCKVSERFGAEPLVQPQRYISVVRPRDKKEIVAIPAVGVVDASLYHEASLRFADQDKELVLLYDGRGLRPGWTDFLSWLDKFLPVKAVKITDAAKVFIP